MMHMQNIANWPETSANRATSGGEQHGAAGTDKTGLMFH